MYTQNTPVHVKLWHRDFWLMALANLFVTAAVYMQMPLLPRWMINSLKLTPEAAGMAMGISGIGLFALGCFCSYLIQHYRRNKVCVIAVIAVGLCSCAFPYIQREPELLSLGFVAACTVRFVQGAVFGLAEMVLSSTLVIDTCESFQRTEANYSAAWFSRLALAAGPALSLWLTPAVGFSSVMIVSALLCALSAACIMMVRFPFKAPEDTVCKVSADRFFLTQGRWLFINLTLITVVIGMMISAADSVLFFSMLFIGLVLAMLAGKYVFVNAELKSEVTTGVLLILAATLVNISGRADAARLMSPVLLGCGTGIVGGRFLLFFIKLSGHCQRGTSQSTFFLSWESGLSAGLFIGYFFCYADPALLSGLALSLLCAALFMYVLFTHKWYMKNKNR